MQESAPNNEEQISVLFTPFLPVPFVPSFAYPALSVRIFLNIRGAFYFANNRVDIKIFSSKWMSVTTLSPRSISLFGCPWSVTSAYINKSCNWFEVFRINASTITTKMVKLQRFIRKRTHYKKINNPMRSPRPPIPFKTTISLAIYTGLPIPASGQWVNFNLNTQSVWE